MRISTLTLEGFGPYRTRQHIDFTRFDADGLFLIAGRTGSGKSSILDAVCFALYGTVPRFDGKNPPVRSQHSTADDPSETVLEFELRGDDYRVRRTPEYDRPSRRGDKLVKQPSDALLSIRDGDDWRPLASGPANVDIEIGRVLPIRRDQFLQVVLLAQNRFQQFLLATTKERRELLQTLFGTARFKQLEDDLAEQRRRLGDGVERRRSSIAESAGTVADAAGVPLADPVDAAWFAAAAATTAADSAAAERTATAARAAHDAAAAHHAALADLAKRQNRHATAEARLAETRARDGVIDEVRVELATADRADRVRPFLRQHVAADAEAASAASARTAALLAWGSDDAPEVAIESLVGDRGALETALLEERAIPAARDVVTRLDAAVAALEARTTALAERRSAARDRADRAESERLVAAATGSTNGADRALVDAAQVAHRAAVAAEALEQRFGVARLAERAANLDAIARRSELAHLLDARFEGRAAELAARLVPGEACAVCGALDHPRPATSDAPPVAHSDIEAARAVSVRADRAAQTASTNASGLGQDLAAARASAGDADFDTVRHQLAASRAAEALSAAALVLAERCALDRDAARADADAAEAATEKVSAERTTASTTRAVAAAELEGLVARVRRARGDATSVQVRVATIDETLQTARTAVAALERSARMAEQAAVAAAALGAALVEQRFVTAAEAVAGLLEPAVAAAARAAVEAHDGAIAAASGVLAEPDLVGLPSEVADPEPARVALQGAQATRDDAVGAASAAAARATSVAASVGAALRSLVESAEAIAAYDRVRALADAVAGLEPNDKHIRLEVYVLAERLQAIIDAANGRLATMSGGRYALELDEDRQRRNVETGLGIQVLDAHTGRLRPATSLSGGEQFLASLALALGLAEVVSGESGGLQLDTLFVDEGFGSLDSETLDVAMAALDDLRAGGRTIGLISHVGTMQERIPAKIEVRVLATGDSVVVQPVGVSTAVNAAHIAA